MGNGCGGGGLCGERGGNCGCDLRLKGCGSVRHPKRNENCGLELAKAAATAETGDVEPKDYLTCRRNGETVEPVFYSQYGMVYNINSKDDIGRRPII